LLGVLRASKPICQSANFINHDEPRQPIKRNPAFAVERTRNLAADGARCVRVVTQINRPKDRILE